jgi:hypothetical protein
MRRHLSHVRVRLRECAADPILVGTTSAGVERGSARRAARRYAGPTSRLQVSPMDVSKTRLQVMVQGLKGPKPSLVTVMSDIVKNEGVVGLYAG